MDGHNRLGSSTSPYLLQHAGNPVHWWPWGEEAFQEARERDLPILLSVGYATCHWCHVMAHESFEDPATADDMNRWFVAVKVDREERPDVDRIYMDAVQTMTGRGGWPMTVFLTPDGKPFYAGTYFPPIDRHGHPSFRRVLFSVHDAWAERRQEVLDQAQRLTAAIDITVPPAPGIPDRPALQNAIATIASTHDPEYGGFGGAPKFPQTPTLEFLLRAAATPWGAAARDPLVTSLTAMARGGIHDRIGGGFARYSVDRRWVVPHFEKMLYDNALLASVYARTGTLTGDTRLGAVAGSTLDYLLRDLRLPDGGFASGEDADSEGHEGTFYVFGHDEVAAAAGDAATPVAELLGVTPGGNFEGRNVLHQAAAPEVVARRHGMDPADLLAAVESTLTRLGEIRGRRTRPARDDKVVTAWNALAIRALVDGTHHLGEPRYLAVAEETGQFLLAHLVRGGRLHRSWRHGQVGPPGFCDDHAALALACFSLFSATGAASWYQAGADLCETLLDRFADPARGGFWATADDAERLITRPKNLFDNPTPSDNALAAEAMLHMAAFTGESRWWDHLDATLRAGGDISARHPGAAGHLLAVALGRDLGIVEVAVVGEDRSALEAVLWERVRPAMVVAPGDGISRRPIPLLHGRPPVEGKATAYVCRDHVCDRPVTTPDDLRAILIGSE